MSMGHRNMVNIPRRDYLPLVCRERKEHRKIKIRKTAVAAGSEYTQSSQLPDNLVLL